MYIMTRTKLCQQVTPMLTVTLTFKKQEPKKQKKKKKKKGKTIVYRLDDKEPRGEG
jgi:hypothetical protein